jgi:hypothetical protein
MAFTYKTATGNQNSITLTVISDGSSSSVDIALSGAPLNLGFTSSSGFPVAVSAPSTMTFFASANGSYTCTYNLNPTTFVLSISFVAIPTAPAIIPAGDGALFTIGFIY